MSRTGDLDREQLRRLRALAHERGVAIGDLIREGVAEVLAQAERKARWAKAWEVVGSLHDPSGARDVSLRHDEYLTGRRSNGRRVR